MSEPKRVYVVHSPEFEPVYYAAVPSLEAAKELIEGLEDAEVLDPDLGGDYVVVPLFEDASSALAAVIAEEEETGD